MWSITGLGALVQHLDATLRVDRSREYLTGLSMGAFGALELAMPSRFAAVARGRRTSPAVSSGAGGEYG